MDKENELLNIRLVGKRWGTVTLPDVLKGYERVVFEKERSSGKIYVRGIKNVDDEAVNGESE